MTMTVRPTEVRAELPAFCGPLGDLNRDAVCARAGRLYTLNMFVTDVERTMTAATRARNPRRAAGLTRWCETVGVERLTDVRRWVADLPPCTHPVEQRVTLDLATALPACTC
jgi:hypothetical protein